jgi:hypothetical protein
MSAATNMLLELNNDKIQLEYIEILTDQLDKVDKDIKGYYKNEKYIKLYTKFRECILCYNLMIEFLNKIEISPDAIAGNTVAKRDADIKTIENIKSTFLKFIKTYKQISNILDLYHKSTKIDDKILNELEKLKIFKLETKVESVNKLKNKLNEYLTQDKPNCINTLFREISEERDHARTKKTSSVVYVYYGDPAIPDDNSNGDKKAKRVREDIIKIDHLSRECTDKFSCALNKTIERSEDFLKSTLNTFNGIKGKPPMKSKEIHTSYFEKKGAELPYYLVWDDQRDYDRIEYDTSGGRKKKMNTTKKNRK